MEGSWGLVFFARGVTGNPDWQRWYNEAQSSTIWETCGFTTRPSWATTYRRFCELEAPRYVAAFEHTSTRFVRLAARNVRTPLTSSTSTARPRTHTRGWSTPVRTPLYCASRTGTATEGPVARASDDVVSDERHGALRGARAG